MAGGAAATTETGVLAVGQLVEIPKRADARGDLFFAQAPDHIPFTPQRAFYIMNVPEGMSRGEHAHKEAEQFLIALRGTADVGLDDGSQTETLTLADPAQALYVPAKTWLSLKTMSTDCILLVLTSTVFDEADYLRNYEEFKTYVS
ncbi:FdtA/QdtA family cupin domain-containing protein [Candidatus Berkelbacteria bacterium]|nr:FdtA/QdtA family cupin domain-containing protein [Candidatus Berkelbacteria bacterium]